MGSPTDANGVHPVGRAAHIRVTSLKTGFWGVYEDSDRDVAITPRLMVTSSGTKARAAQAALWLSFRHKLLKSLWPKSWKNYHYFQGFLSILPLVNLHNFVFSYWKSDWWSLLRRKYTCSPCLYFKTPPKLTQFYKKVHFFAFFWHDWLLVSVIYCTFAPSKDNRGPRRTLTECIRWGERRTSE